MLFLDLYLQNTINQKPSSHTLPLHRFPIQILFEFLLLQRYYKKSLINGFQYFANIFLID